MTEITYLQNKKKDSKRNQNYGYQRGSGGRDRLGIWD